MFAKFGMTNDNDITGLCEDGANMMADFMMSASGNNPTTPLPLLLTSRAFLGKFFKWVIKVTKLLLPKIIFKVLKLIIKLIFIFSKMMLFPDGNDGIKMW